MDDFREKLMRAEAEKGTMLCFGMDPVIERMQIDPSESLSDEITRYFCAVLDAIKDKISAVKPNVAFYLQYGEEGLKALVRLVKRAGEIGLPVIVDAKLGDIGRTSKAYAKYVFEVLEGDAVTLNPYMGEDALEPFFSYKKKGFFVLVLTSNPGAGDVQLSSLASGEKLYTHVIRLICAWNRTFRSVGAVVGATKQEFARCVHQIGEEGVQVPLLIPGVGAQGASYKRTEKILKEHDYERGIVRINASSSISYAHERFPSTSPEEAARLACEEIMKG
jgi:orotidine-5'-phosphate decarboxylase